MTQQDLFAAMEAPRRAPSPSMCIRPAHWPIRIEAKPKPDTDWWCAFCGTRGLPAPPPRKSWE